MLAITFAGWGQCRLATDPDPYDEPRGVSGYLHAYAGEPDLDRLIKLQAPPFRRSHTPQIGVTVRSVTADGVPVPAHPLVGGEVDLLGGAKFEGRNGVIAEDGLEPIAPFHLDIHKGAQRFSRATVPTDPRSPYREFNAINIVADPGFIERATGIASLTNVWRERLRLLADDLAAAPPDDRPAIEERMAFLDANLAAGGGVARFFPVRMTWDYQLRSPVAGTDLAVLLPGFTPTPDPWRVSFWMGAWDADAQAFFIAGVLEIRQAGEAVVLPMARRPERLTDIHDAA